MHVALIFTAGVSLQTWSESGIAVRDSLLYERLCRLGHRVTFVTYGKTGDADYLEEGSAIEVLSRPAGMNASRYGRRLFEVHGPALAGVDVIKTHQMRGARYAAWLALRMRKPLVVRCGYLRTIFLRGQAAGWRERVQAAAEEWFAFRRADVAVVPARSDADYIRRRYGVAADRIVVSPNWIDTERFRPSAQPLPPRRIVGFVGRFAPQKQPLMLLEALRGIPDVELLMIGGGELESDMRSRIRQFGIRATILDRVPNEDLPGLLQSCSLFALPTRFEGSPKAVMEAMACGLPIVSTDAPGMEDVLEDGVQGRKVPMENVEAFREAIRDLLDHPDRARTMGELGRQRIMERFSIERAVERELELYDRLLGGRTP
jgi:glycosyltransferase involved in cell wall biosynthesis